MNCYAGLAKRLIKSCFPPVIPVPQLEPLDARLIIKQEVKDNNTNKACFALSDAHERVFKPISFKPISDEEAWAATLAWAEVKAQEREAAVVKAASQTNTDESYDSDDEFDNDKDALYVTPPSLKGKLDNLNFMPSSSPKFIKAAIIIQAAERGRAVRAWKAQFIDKLAIELVEIYRMRYLKRDSADWRWWFDALILENAASPICVIAWIKLAEQRRYGHYF